MALADALPLLSPDIFCLQSNSGDKEVYVSFYNLPEVHELRALRTERLYFITTRFYRGDPAGSSLFALPCL